MYVNHNKPNILNCCMQTKLANSAIISLFRAHMIMSKKTKVRHENMGRKANQVKELKQRQDINQLLSCYFQNLRRSFSRLVILCVWPAAGQKRKGDP
jgi:mannitol-specific phosphotransferase system IIBC component